MRTYEQKKFIAMSIKSFIIKLRIKAVLRRCNRLSDYIGTMCSIVLENMLKTDDFADKVKSVKKTKNDKVKPKSK